MQAHALTPEEYFVVSLPCMYGPSRFMVMDEAGRLPFKVADIYRRLAV